MTHISRNLIQTPWAILPEKLEVIVAVVNRYFSGEKLTAEEVQMRIQGAAKPNERAIGSVAILPLFGTIFPRANLFSETSGGTSAEVFGKRFDELVRDPSVGAIILDIDSPGGQSTGIQELSKKIYEARGSKPIIAMANYLAASAAYWIATAADEIVVSPSGEVGSVGVYAVHEDDSQSLANDGIKMTFISEGKYKTEGNPYEPLSDEARAAIQQRVSEVYQNFTKDIARNRGVSQADAMNKFGEGRVISAKQAVSMGMADRIATMDETIQRVQRGLAKRPGGQQKAIVDPVNDKKFASDLDFRRRRLRLMENSGSVETD